jgi:hypothetical protein
MLNLATQAAFADPPQGAGPAYSAADVVRLMAGAGGCAAGAPRTVAQVSPSASPSASAPPSPEPTLTPEIPPIPMGPGTLFPQQPTPSGQTTAPPLPTTPPSSKSNGPVDLVQPTGTPAPLVRPSPGATAAPSPSPSASPSPVPTLGPNEYALLFDRIDGSTKDGAPQDVSGNVTIFYRDGMVHGDRAHDGGDGIIHLTGNTYLINQRKDAIFYADEINFNRKTQIATLVNGRGETYEGVEQGKLYYRASELTTQNNGVSHGERAWFSTCEHPRGGYHVESRTLDVKPHDRLVARKAVLYLGAAAVFYIPVLVIPLRDVKDPRRQTSFVPEIGYSDLEGVYEHARIGFGADQYYYGVYRVDFATKRGLGLGYIGTITRKDNRRQTTIDAYTIDDHIVNARQNTLNISDTENFSQHLRGQFGVNYNSNFGPSVYLPPSYAVNGSLIHTSDNATENLTFTRNLQGSLYDSFNTAFVETLRMGPALNQAFNVSYTKYGSTYQTTSTLHLNSLTQYTTRGADYAFTIDKSDSPYPSAFDKVPELQITPHITLGRFPIQSQVTLGQYTEQQNAFSTQRADIFASIPAYFRAFHDSDVTANLTVRQDFYGTGDAKAFVTQQASISTPFGNHFINSITYNEQNPIGPANVPFQTLDHLSSGSHGAQDVLRIYNKDVYSLSLATSTFFDMQAQPISYQFTSRPSPRSVLIFGGYWSPGPGNGFGTTNVQLWTPFGRGTDITFTTNVDWKNKARLENKNIGYRKIIGDCYDFRINFNEDIKQYSVNFDLLAFPSRSAGFGLGQNTRSILPQSLAF